jgi:hypothetical protein
MSTIAKSRSRRSAVAVLILLLAAGEVVGLRTTLPPPQAQPPDSKGRAVTFRGTAILTLSGEIRGS